MTETTLSITDQNELLALFGPRDQHLRRVRRLFDVRITQRNGEIRISGENESVHQATRTLQKLRHLSRRQGELSPGDVDRAASEEGASVDSDLLLAQPSGTSDSASVRPSAPSQPSTNSESNQPPARQSGGKPEDIQIHHAGRRIKPRTKGQAKYVDSIRDHDLTFATGPAGCGKTYLAVAMAVEALREGKVRKIVLVRPAVEAGESLGFLPGDLRAKLNPYLRPLMDALGEMVDYDQARGFMEKDVIEVIPLAYMRGRTLNDAFIILDEAQNTTVPQMKMFLTRMGERSKMVVSGDATQLDLPKGVTSGLHDAIRRLEKIKEIGTVRLQASDIVRHKLVQQIVSAYEDTDGNFDQKHRHNRNGRKTPSSSPGEDR